MKVILMGLHGDASTGSVAAGLAPFFKVRHVTMVRDGDPDNPWAVVEVDDSYQHVWDVCNRLRGVFHRGKRIHLYIPLHQDAGFHELAPHERIDIH